MDVYVWISKKQKQVKTDGKMYTRRVVEVEETFVFKAWLHIIYLW